jgi:Tol biopolymer transport system component
VLVVACLNIAAATGCSTHHASARQVPSTTKHAGSAPGPPNAVTSRLPLTFTQFESRRGNNESVWVAAADGSHARRIAAHAEQGTLSPDGRWLTFERSSGAMSSLFVVDLTTGKTRPLGKTTGDERWAPTGARLAVSQPGGFFLIDPASGKRKLLAARVDSFDFTPDGSSIVLAKDSGAPYESTERSDIFQLRLSSHALTRLTHDGHSKRPLVSRKGIVYVRFNNNPYPRYETWQMARDGSRQRVVARCCESKSDTYANSAYGFTTIGLSTDGTRLLACMPSEFACNPIAIDLPGGREYAFPELGNLGTPQEVSWALDLTPDGRTALIFIRPANDGPGPWLLYAVPFSGGKPALLARNALDGHWRH